MLKKVIFLFTLIISLNGFAQNRDYRADFEKLDTTLSNIEAGFQTKCQRESTSSKFCLGSEMSFGYCYWSVNYTCGEVNVKAKFKKTPNFNSAPETEIRKIKMTIDL